MSMRLSKVVEGILKEYFCAACKKPFPEFILIQNSQKDNSSTQRLFLK
jgi:DNA-directed RNA polymerase subunit RPC12/RpoP